jgi:hypothetical protein
MCRTGCFNLSYESLTSYEARQKLRDVKSSDPEQWAQLTQTAASESDATAEESQFKAEDDENIAPFFEDDSDLACNKVISSVLEACPEGVGMSAANGDFVSTRAAESIDNDEVTNRQQQETELGRGKRKKQSNKLYSSFWRHNDNAASDNENDGI